LTSRPSKKIEKSLKNLGFSLENSHHRQLIYLTINGEDHNISTYLSHGSKDYGDDLLAKMSKQLYLTKSELLDLIDGKMTRKTYENILKIKNII
jgi:predicted RNA binding protein YcfA (HicA-like mRNA interferase family)